MGFEYSDVGVTHEVPSRRMPDAEAEGLIRAKVNIERLERKLHTELFKREPGELLALARLVVELREELPQYDTILSDDASGHMVSLVMRKIIDAARKEAVEKPTQTYFLTGPKSEFEESVQVTSDFIRKKKDVLGKTLLMTEYISTGNVAETFTSILEGEGVDFDLATVSIKTDPSGFSPEMQRHLYYGTVGMEGVGFSDAEQYSGVVKGDWDAEVVSPHPVTHQANPALMREARMDVDLVAQELSKLVH